MTLALIAQAVKQGLALEAVCDRLGLSARTVQRWKRVGTNEDLRCGPRTQPANRLSEAERRHVLEVANSEEFRALSPKQIVPRLADRGEYIASESTFGLESAGSSPVALALADWMPWSYQASIASLAPGTAPQT